MTYKPKPLDTSQVRLGAALTELTEHLAENTHEIWAQQRLSEGWRFGHARDDISKEHPCLVPYSELPENEKEYDRRTALETMKMLLALGYRIESPQATLISAAGASKLETEERNRIQALLAKGPRLHEVIAVWNGRNPEVWSKSAELFRLVGERILKLGEPLLAYDVLNQGLEHFPGYLPLRQLLGLALARSGATEAATAVLTQIYREGHQDEETLGLLGRTYKDLAESTTDTEKKEKYLRRAKDSYAKAYELTAGYYSGVNAATLAVLLGEREFAAKLAGEVKVLCLDELKRLEEKKADTYWVRATLGEAALILGAPAEAEEWYGRAVEVGKKRYGDLNSSRRNARLLMAGLGAPSSRIEACFHIPSVVLFAGHMIDQAGRAEPRFPAQLEPHIYAEIREQLDKLDAGFGYSAAACGADILFLEAMMERDAEVYVVLPYETGQFVEDSVDRAPGWKARFEKAVAEAAEVIVASGQRTPGGILHEYANRMMYGLAAARAEKMETRLRPLAVWNGAVGDGPGGTASAVQFWREAGAEVQVIDLATILQNDRPAEIRTRNAEPAAAAPPPALARAFAPEIRALLFADAVGFSKLSEEQVPLFVEHFLGLVGKLAWEITPAPLMKNTWGDGLYFVFPDVRSAGRFALELRDRVKATHWAEKGLQDLGLRIGLHAGPVYACVDPVTERPSYVGAHVSRAARIEPITPPGNVYASQPFAALAAAEKGLEFRCDYVGQTAMAKHYGTFPTYVVRYRTPEAAP